MPAYPDLWHRLVANTVEPGHGAACWPWKGKRDRWWYGRLNVYVPGLGRTATVMAHVAAWVWLHAAPASVDEWYLAYCELRASGLQLDHLCVDAQCINPDHFEPVTPSENCKRRNDPFRR